MMFARLPKAGPLFQQIRYSTSLSKGTGHVHALNNGTDAKKYAVSIVSSKDLDKKALNDYPELIIGWTPYQDQVEPKTFIPNAAFVDYMTTVFSEHIHQVNDTALKGMAQWQKEGWLHVGDERNPPPWGRIPKPEDIIGSVLLQEGKIQPKSYQAMPAYRLVTNKGLMQLSPALEKCLLDIAKQKLK